MADLFADIPATPTDLFADIVPFSNVQGSASSSPSFANVTGSSGAPQQLQQLWDQPIGDAPPDFGSSPQNESNALRSSGAMDSAANAVSEIPGGLFQGLQQGGNELGKWAGLAASGAAGLFDDIAGTDTQDAVFKNAVQPFDEASQANQQQLAQKGLLGQVAGGLGRAVPDLALGLASGGESALPRVAPLLETQSQAIGRMLMDTVEQSTSQVAPLAEKLSSQAYGQAVAEGKTDPEATAEALKAIGSTMALGVIGAGSAGSTLGRVAQGVGANVAAGEAVRTLEGRPFDPVEAGVNAALGGGFAFAHGHGPEEAPRSAETSQRSEAIQNTPEVNSPEVNLESNTAEKPRVRVNPETGAFEEAPKTALFDDIVSEPTKASENVAETTGRPNSPVEAEAPQKASEAAQEGLEKPAQSEIEGFEDLVPDNAALAAPADGRLADFGIGDVEPREGIAAQRSAPTARDILDYSKEANIPLRVAREYHEGTLSTGKLLDAISNNEGGKYTQAPQLRGLASYLKEAGERLGGLETPIQRFDPQAHAGDLARFPHISPDRAAGYYESGQDVIRVHGDAPKMHVLLHEAVHSLTARAVANGQRGQLAGEAARSYGHLQKVFDATKTHLESKGDKSYGLTNLDEGLAEFFANGRFRQLLKNTKLDDIDPKVVGGFGRLAIAKARNVYDSVVSGIRGILSLPVKAESAMDALFAAQHKFLTDLRPHDRLVGAERRGLYNLPEEAHSLPLDAVEPRKPSREEIQARAKAAVARGADPIRVQARIRELYETHGHEELPTGVKNAKVAEERFLKGQAEVEYEGRRSDAKVWDNAIQRIKENPTYGTDLASSLLAKPRAPSAEETAALTQDRMRIHNEQNETYRRIADAISSKDPDAESVARERLKTLEAQREVNDLVAKSTGTESSAALRLRRYLARSDYSMADVQARAKTAAGKEVPKDVKDRLEAATAEIQRLSDRLDVLEKQKISSKADRIPTDRKKAADAKFKDLSARLKAIRQKDHLTPGCAA